jgi:hypothetical protein
VALSQRAQFENKNVLHWPLHDYWLSYLYEHNTELFIFSDIFVLKPVASRNMSLPSKIAFGAAVTTSVGVISYVHYKQQLDR